MKIAKATADDMRRMLAFFGELEEALRDLRCGASVDDEKLGALVKRHWGNHSPGVGSSWRRVVRGMGTLLENCTDPDADTLEWRPDVREWLESQEAKAAKHAVDVGPECPYCRFVHSDTEDWQDIVFIWGTESGPVDYECSRCGLVFKLHESVSRTWESRPIVQ